MGRVGQQAEIEKMRVYTHPVRSVGLDKDIRYFEPTEQRELYALDARVEDGLGNVDEFDPVDLVGLIDDVVVRVVGSYSPVKKLQISRRLRAMVRMGKIMKERWSDMSAGERRELLKKMKKMVGTRNKWRKVKRQRIY